MSENSCLRYLSVTLFMLLITFTRLVWGSFEECMVMIITRLLSNDFYFEFWIIPSFSHYCEIIDDLFKPFSDYLIIESFPSVLYNQYKVVMKGIDWMFALIEFIDWHYIPSHSSLKNSIVLTLDLFSFVKKAFTASHFSLFSDDLNFPFSRVPRIISAHAFVSYNLHSYKNGETNFHWFYFPCFSWSSYRSF